MYREKLREKGFIEDLCFMIWSDGFTVWWKYIIELKDNIFSLRVTLNELTKEGKLIWRNGLDMKTNSVLDDIIKDYLKESNQLKVFDFDNIWIIRERDIYLNYKW